eukprot:TRINITY_DN22650_c0_g1_i4.p1 TRINITY_DN22650_c0_g1~~TRINITY_DN22650_c0_g1_i4.p1  ORF type:complete len:321 (+),score=55.41 TRINITY_DN22650_c0_g1_i4:41-1003(+)
MNMPVQLAHDNMNLPVDLRYPGDTARIDRAERRRGPSPPRVTEADILREQKTHGYPGKMCKSAAKNVPTTVLSLWQPLASFLAHGIQRVEGRGWNTAFRGKLWIHAGSKPVDKEDIERWESIYRDVFAADGMDAKMPEHYPTSALVGLVEVVDVVSADEFSSWSSLPVGVRKEGRAHGSGYLFLVEKHQRLAIPLKHTGQHKLWRLDQKFAANAFRGLLESELTPAVRFSQYQELAKSKQGSSSASEGVRSTSRKEADELADAIDSDLEDHVDRHLLEVALQQSLAESLRNAPAAAEASASSPQGQGSRQERRRGRWRKG